ncbi:MAG: hypothetical protein GF417_14205, partial [Candidatus Latescibacteria bacterium]|nr:hypothetical protein [bacterium]MBD3425584.1 hypothetical protein [Candidatus Latescibacterota bacterium]
MDDKKKKRDIRRELDELKRKAADKFRQKGISEPERGFLERASRFDPETGGKEPVGDSVGSGRDEIILGRLRGILSGFGDDEAGQVVSKTDFMKLEEAVPGFETDYGSGSFYRIINSSEGLESAGQEGIADIISPVATEPGGAETELELLENLSPEKVCYLDI